MKQYLIYAWDGDDKQALERRMSIRQAHLAGGKQLKANGNFILGGAMLNAEGQMIGSTMILQFETEEEFEHWKNTEPYILNGVWKKVEIHPFKVANI
ncbi:MAG: hypothetical protein IE931_08205 [Sphingobacteriales bacterium]|nr:hypothetical protein [Sphingobacteriales bacterium]